MKFKMFFFVSMSLLMAACQDSAAEKEANKILEQAAAIHMEAVKVGSAITPKMEELIQRRNSLNVEARELTEEELAFTAKVDAIERSYQWYEDNHVEVPGFGHEGHDHDDHEGHDHDHEGHDHDHDHDHDHGPELKVLPADMLRIQEEFRDTILSIQKRVMAM
ncbi:MAG: hypothetical protein AAF798_17545 [Bacteroidota bacterium]